MACGAFAVLMVVLTRDRHPSDPWAIAITPDGQTAYVAVRESGTVVLIATATNTPGEPIKVGGAPYAIAITP